MGVGKKIQELRKQNNFSQEQLAEKMNVARQTISKWELGETSPDLSQAKLLSQIFKVSLDELTNNDIKNVLMEKVSNTERLAGMIINILKIFGFLLLVITILVITIILCRKYYEVKPNYMVADSYGIYCTMDNEKNYYEVTMTRENPNVFELNKATEEIVKEMNIDIKKYSNKDKLIKDIKHYIVSIGGTCS